MKRRGYARRSDANQPEIVKALRKIGCSVFIVEHPVDLLVGYQSRNYLIEVKNPDKPKSGQKKTKFQDDFFKDWKGQVRIVRTAEEAIKLVTEAYKG